MDEPTRSEVESMDLIEQIAAAGGGKITERVNDLGDGSGYAIVSFPLRKDHWIYQRDDTPAGFKSNVPPMPFRMGSRQAFSFGICDIPEPDQQGAVRFDNPIIGTLNKREFEKAVRAAGKYAVRCATMNGAEMDFDPDALLQNLVVGMLGYWTDTGLIGCAEDAPWCDPQAPFDFHVEPPVNYGLVQEQATGTAPQPPEE
jgi:hypothetical protein